MDYQPPYRAIRQGAESIKWCPAQFFVSEVNREMFPKQTNQGSVFGSTASIKMTGFATLERVHHVALGSFDLGVLTRQFRKLPFIFVVHRDDGEAAGVQREMSHQAMGQHPHFIRDQIMCYQPTHIPAS